MTKKISNGTMVSTEVVVFKTTSENLFTIVGKEVFSLQNTIQYDKPFLDYNGMIQLMKSRNIIISDTAFAQRALSNFSYYMLVNGYKNTFPIDAQTECFLTPIKFEELYTLHIIDTGLNSILLKNILIIEHSLKSKLSFIIAKNYGVYTDVSDTSNSSTQDYLCSTHYTRNNIRNNILRKLKQSLTEHTRNNIIRHYERTKNHIPPWILTTNIPLGLTIKWYSILKSHDKEYVCNAFIDDNRLTPEQKKEFLIKSLNLLKEYRNIIAHGNRTFSNSMRCIIPKQQLLLLSPNLLSEHEYNSGIGQKDLMAIILTIIALLNDKYMVANFIHDILSTFSPYENLKFASKSIFDIFELPDDFMKRMYSIIN